MKMTNENVSDFIVTKVDSNRHGYVI